MEKQIMRHWLIEQLAIELECSIDEVDCDQAFGSMSLDSLSMISIIQELENEFKLDEIDPTVLRDQDSVNKLSLWLETKN
jgi:acyl carrier protein